MDDHSVAIVVLDTLRKDTFDRYFEWVEGTVFDIAYSTSHWTVPAHASLLTGKYGSEVGVHGKSRIFDYPGDTIVEKLQESGYTTRLWTANIQIHAWDGWDRGFDEVRGPGELHPLADMAVDWSAFSKENERSGPLMYLNAIRHAVRSPEGTLTSLRDGYRRFSSHVGNLGAEMVYRRLQRTNFTDGEFLLINLMEPHTPHLPPEPYRTYAESINYKIGDAFANAIEEPHRNRRAYDDSAAYLSSTYREVYRELQQSFDMIITLSDHGELLGEHDMWNHGYGIYPKLVEIPFVVWMKDGTPPEVATDDVVSILDVPQTIAGRTGISFESRGLDLFQNNEPTDRLVEYHGFLPWHREQLERKGVGELYDRLDGDLNGIVTESGTYYYETHDDGLCCGEGPVGEGVRARLDDHVGRLSKRSISQDESDIPSDVRDRLADLGYA